MKTFQKLLTLFVISLFFAAKPAHAYLDPGTGSYILQMILAGTLGGAYLLRGYAGKLVGGVKSVFSKVTGKKDGKK
jgi:hypothetical protein